jgi:hypothetical protein
MASPAPRSRTPEAPPDYDPGSIRRRLALARARREARLEQKRWRRAAQIRFAVVLLFLLAVIVAIGVFIYLEIQRLFGI